MLLFFLEMEPQTLIYRVVMHLLARHLYEDSCQAQRSWERSKQSVTYKEKDDKYWIWQCIWFSETFGVSMWIQKSRNMLTLVENQKKKLCYRKSERNSVFQIHQFNFCGEKNYINIGKYHHSIHSNHYHWIYWFTVGNMNFVKISFATLLF